MANQTLNIRTATIRDVPGVDRLLARSYPRLLKADYPPSVMVTAVPLIARARPQLVASGSYYVVEMEGEGIVGAGGFSLKGRHGAVGEVRHVVTDWRYQRQGIGRRLLEGIISEARALGLSRLDCMATRTAVPFYTAMGFRGAGEVEIGLAPGISFPAVAMMRLV